MSSQALPALGELALPAEVPETLLGPAQAFAGPLEAADGSSLRATNEIVDLLSERAESPTFRLEDAVRGHGLHAMAGACPAS